MPHNEIMQFTAMSIIWERMSNKVTIALQRENWNDMNSTFKEQRKICIQQKTCSFFNISATELTCWNDWIKLFYQAFDVDSDVAVSAESIRNEKYMKLNKRKKKLLLEWKIGTFGYNLTTTTEKKTAIENRYLGEPKKVAWNGISK